jgi:hypothetical protein
VRAATAVGSIPVPYGSPAVFTESVYSCDACSTSGDFAGVNDAVVNEALGRARSSAAEETLRWFAEQGISSPHFERALRLPMRTTHPWRAGNISPAEVALLQILRTYPWILDVADASFEPGAAAQAVLRAAASYLADAASTEPTGVKS